MTIRTAPDAKEVARTTRNQRIVDLHIDGLTEREIARLVGCSRTTVWTVLQRAKAAR